MIRRTMSTGGEQEREQGRKHRQLGVKKNETDEEDIEDEEDREDKTNKEDKADTE